MASNTASGDIYWNTTTAINNTAGNMNFTTTAANTNYAAGVSYIPFTYTYNAYQAPLPAYDFYAGEPMEEVVKKLRDHIKNLEGRIQQLETPILKPIPYSPGWPNLVEMLENLKAFKAANNHLEIIAYDDIEHHKYVLATKSPGSWWEIDMDTAKNTPQQFWISDGEAVLIPDCFEDIELRKVLLNMLNRK